MPRQKWKLHSVMRKSKNKKIIVKINDDKISSMNTLKQALIKYNVGDTAKLTYIRDGKEKVENIKFDNQENLY